MKNNSHFEKKSLKYSLHKVEWASQKVSLRSALLWSTSEVWGQGENNIPSPSRSHRVPVRSDSSSCNFQECQIELFHCRDPASRRRPWCKNGVWIQYWRGGWRLCIAGVIHIHRLVAPQHRRWLVRALMIVDICRVSFQDSDVWLTRSRKVWILFLRLQLLFFSPSKINRRN